MADGGACAWYYNEEEMLDAMSIELDAFVDEHLAQEEVLRQSGCTRVAEAFQPVQTATTVRIRNGKDSTTEIRSIWALKQPWFRTRHW